MPPDLKATCESVRSLHNICAKWPPSPTPPLAHEKAIELYNVCKRAETNVCKEIFEECAIVDAASSLASPTLWLARRVWRLSPHQSTA